MKARPFANARNLFVALLAGVFMIQVVLMAKVIDKRAQVEESNVPTDLRKFPHEPNSSVVLIRSHSFSEGMVERFRQMNKDLAREGMDLWVSVDTTRSGSMALWDGVHVHEYSAKDLIEEFPGMSKANVHASSRMWKNLMSMERSVYTWGYHAEAIGLWWETYLLAGGHADYVWILEQDVGVTGDFTDILHQYDDSSADFISYNTMVAFPKWAWGGLVTKEFDQIVPRDKIMKTNEHVQRLSSRFLNLLLNCSKSNIIGWSEASIPSLANYYGMEMAELEKDHLGVPYKWHSNLTLASWERKMENDKRKGVTKLYHPVKH